MLVHYPNLNFAECVYEEGALVRAWLAADHSSQELLAFCPTAKHPRNE